MSNNETICIIAVTLFVLLFLAVALIAVLHCFKESITNKVDDTLRKVDFGLQENYKMQDRTIRKLSDLMETLESKEQVDDK